MGKSIQEKFNRDVLKMDQYDPFYTDDLVKLDDWASSHGLSVENYRLAKKTKANFEFYSSGFIIVLCALIALEWFILGVFS